MARRELLPADPLDGTESLIVSQKGLARKGWVGLICDYVMSCIDRGALKGDPGPAGPQGVAGPKGATGTPGAAGATGPQGAAGPAGAAGPSGPQGPAGQAGSPGVAGAKGDAGPAGVAGLTGPKGDVGASGSQGAPGATGATGAKGDAGAAGAVGATGATGAAGTPKRVERYTATTNASGIATFTFSPAFAAAPDVDVIQGWVNDQEVGGAVQALTASGCTVLTKVSKGTLLLTAGPFQTAGAGVSVTIRAIGN